MEKYAMIINRKIQHGKEVISPLIYKFSITLINIPTELKKKIEIVNFIWEKKCANMFFKWDGDLPYEY